MLLMQHLKGRAFVFVYDAFAKDGQFAMKGKSCENVKQTLIDKYGRTNCLPNKVRRALKARLDQKELWNLLNKISYLWKTLDKKWSLVFAKPS